MGERPLETLRAVELGGVSMGVRSGEPGSRQSEAHPDRAVHRAAGDAAKFTAMLVAFLWPEKNLGPSRAEAQAL